MNGKFYEPNIKYHCIQLITKLIILYNNICLIINLVKGIIFNIEYGKNLATFEF